MQFYDNFSALCKEVGKSAPQVMKELGMGRNTHLNWKEGKTEPTESTMRKIADYFGVPTDYLLNGGDTKIDNVANGTITGASIVVGNRAGSISSTVGAPACASDGLTEQETELLRIFRSIGVRKQTKLMSLAYEIEEE